MRTDSNRHPSTAIHPLKFLMITTFYPPYNFGGDGIYIYRLCNELARRGHKVDIVHSVEAYELLEKGGPKGHYPNHPNITVYPLKTSLGFLSSLATQQTGRSYFKRNFIKNLIKKNNYDIIHYHNMSLIGLEVLSYGEAIKLYHTHEHWLICPMHVLWKYNREVCTKPACIRCQLLGKRPPQFWRYSTYLEKQLKHVDMFLSPSLFTRQKHLEAGLQIPIMHLPYFLPTRETPDEPTDLLPHTTDRPFFLFVGRLEKIKGVQNLIRVFKHYPSCNLLIAGDGEYEEILKKQARNISNVIFLGRLPYQQLRGYYKKAQALLVSSICYEVFGIIIIEAFSQKTPVIANNLGALPEVIKQSGGGFVYDSDEELVEHMEKFRQNHHLRTELGEKGYRAYKKYWTEEYHLKKYFGIIKALAIKKRIKHPFFEQIPETSLDTL
ncbi:MAG: glycosyltransferase [Calditrichaeota bacterium]|nr:MAG: glycosyltransferase [Calditrichota bacterium]